MADSTLTIKIVAQNTGNATASPLQKDSNGAAITPPIATARPIQSAPQSPSQQSQARADKSLANLALGLIAHQGFSSITSALGTIPGQTQTANRLSNIGGGAIAGAATGAMFGPIGIALGATIGTATGALKTLADEAKSTRDALRALKDDAKMTGLTTGAKRQDAAFIRTLHWMTPQQRDNAIAERANQINRGTGDTSVRSLTNAIERMAKNGLTDTPEYKEKQSLLAMQKSRLASLGELSDQNYFQVFPTLLKASAIADPIQKIGGKIGETINVKDSNREMIDLLREIASSSRTLASHSPDTQRGLDAASGLGVFLPQ